MAVRLIMWIVIWRMRASLRDAAERKDSREVMARGRELLEAIIGDLYAVRLVLYPPDRVKEENHAV